MNPLTLTAEELKQVLPEKLPENTREIHYFLVQQNGYWELDSDRPNTLRACWEVLCRLPSDVTEDIMYGDPIVLIAPSRSCWALARPMSFPVPPDPEHPKVSFSLGLVYLAPELEDQPDRVLVASVAHELAHVIVGDFGGEQPEEQADSLI